MKSKGFTRGKHKNIKNFIACGTVRGYTAYLFSIYTKPDFGANVIIKPLHFESSKCYRCNRTAFTTVIQNGASENPAKYDIEEKKCGNCKSE
jgi:hypothetical protein